MKNYLKSIFKTTEINCTDIINDIDEKIDNNDFDFENIKRELRLIKPKSRSKKKKKRKVFLSAFFLAGIFSTILLFTTQGDGFLINDKNIRQASDNIVITLNETQTDFNKLTEQLVENNLKKMGYKNVLTNKSDSTSKNQVIRKYKNGKKEFDVYLEQYKKEQSRVVFIGPFNFGKEIVIANQKYIILSNSNYSYFIKYDKYELVYFCGELKQNEFIKIIKQIEESD